MYVLVVGVAAIFWIILRCRNDIVFERTISNDSVVLIKSNVADKGGKSKGVDAGSKNHRACK